MQISDKTDSQQWGTFEDKRVVVLNVSFYVNCRFSNHSAASHNQRNQKGYKAGHFFN